MVGIARLGLLIVICFTISAGCSQNEAPAPAASTTTNQQAVADASQPDFSQNPIAQAASEFLDAVMKGDTERGTARLTPQAREKIVASGMKFDPPGVENPHYRIVGVRQAGDKPDFAGVQYEFSYTERGQVTKEDMACALRRVNNTWCVYGLVHGMGPGKPWNLRNFETDKDIPVLSGTTNGGAPQDVRTTSRPSPPRTAQEAPAISPPAERR